MTLESLDQYYHGEDSGRVIRNACENVSVMNEAAHQLVVANGLEDVIIVNTADAVYVSRKSEADQIKSIIRENYEKQQSYFDEGTVYYKMCIRDRFYMGVKEEGLTQAEHALESLKEAMTKIVQ